MPPQDEAAGVEPPADEVDDDVLADFPQYVACRSFSFAWNSSLHLSSTHPLNLSQPRYRGSVKLSRAALGLVSRRTSLFTNGRNDRRTLSSERTNPDQPTRVHTAPVPLIALEGDSGERGGGADDTEDGAEDGSAPTGAVRKARSLQTIPIPGETLNDDMRSVWQRRRRGSGVFVRGLSRAERDSVTQGPSPTAPWAKPEFYHTSADAPPQRIIPAKKVHNSTYVLLLPCSSRARSAMTCGHGAWRRDTLAVDATQRAFFERQWMRSFADTDV